MQDIRAFINKKFRKNSAAQIKDLTMRQVFNVTKTRNLPNWKQWKQLPKILSRKEKKAILICMCVSILSAASYGIGYVLTHRIDIPAIGGDYTEGLIGEPQFINPLYATVSDVDQDITKLIYSGLVRLSPNEGFINDLAESTSISEDGLTYTIKIRDNAKFHNGDDVRARDVLFTIDAIKNPAYRSTLIDGFYNVEVSQVDDKTVSFTLKEPFAPFISHLTVGILPATLWGEIMPQNAPLAALNLQPVGSGPYKFSEFAKDKRGSIRSYTLARNDDYYNSPPLIETITFKFYQDAKTLVDALENKNVEGAGFVGFNETEQVSVNKNVNLFTPLMSKETLLYFNQSVSPALADPIVRLAIAKTINAQQIVADVYNGNARVIYGPILEGAIGYDETLSSIFDPTSANNNLDEAGYTKQEGQTIRRLKKSLRKEEAQIDEDKDTTDNESTNEKNLLRLTLTAPEGNDMREVAQIIKNEMAEIGIRLETTFVNPENMMTNIVEPRNFELLLIPIILESDPDPYTFWHSSQTEGSGLNIANYKNTDVDTLLVEARKDTDPSAREQKYKQFQALLSKDIPAVFLFQSDYAFAVGNKIHMEPVEKIVIPSDRFANITSWYIKTKKALR